MTLLRCSRVRILSLTALFLPLFLASQGRTQLLSDVQEGSPNGPIIPGLLQRQSNFPRHASPTMRRLWEPLPNWQQPYLPLPTDLLPGIDTGTIFAAGPPTYPTGGSLPSAVAQGDFNGDGNTDLVIANSGPGNVGVLLGGGDGTFHPVQTYDAGVQVVAVAVGDFDKDGKLDVIATDGSTLSVLLGNGDGSLQSPHLIHFAGSDATSLLVADFNRDGNPDIALASGTSNTVLTFLGNGNGGFSQGASYPVQDGQGLAVADFDGDSKLDLATSAGEVLLGNGDGSFQPATGAEAAGRSVAAGDFNGDGHQDLVVSGGSSVEVLLGKGDGTFVSPVIYSVRNGWAVTIADFNLDGNLDIAVLDAGGLKPVLGSLGILLGNGDGSFQSPVSYNTGGCPTIALVIGDFNKDGRPDAAAVEQQSSDVSILLGNGDGSMPSAVLYGSEWHYMFSSYSVAIADFDGDGNADMAVADLCENSENCEHGSVSVLLGNGDGTVRNAVIYPSGGEDSVAVVSGDLNGDGVPDLILTNECPDSNCNLGSMSVLLGNGGGTFQPAVNYLSGGAFTTSVAIADFNGDGKADVVLANHCSDPSCFDGLSVLLGNGDGTFQPATNVTSGGTIALSVVTGDFNGDGLADIAVAEGPFGHPGLVGVLLGNGDGTFQPSVGYTSGQNGAYNLTVGDFNQDGNLDVGVANGDNCTDCGGDFSVLLGNGNGTFRAAGGGSVGGEPRSVAAGDFNGDGYLDLALGIYCGDATSCQFGSVQIALGNNDGTFQPALTEPMMLGFLAVGDFNKDGKPDIAGSLEFDTGASILLNVARKFHFVTTTKLHPSANPSDFGHPLVLIATVTASHTGILSGSVTFYDGSTVLATAGLDGKRAKFSISSLSPGIHAITAAYSGNKNFLPSNSPVLNEHIHQAASVTSVASSLNPSVYNQSVTFTASVTSSGGVPADGELVTFRDGATKLGTAPLQSGIANFTTASLLTGIHKIMAVYLGDADLKPSNGKLKQTVKEARTTSKLVSFLNPSQFGQKVKFRVRVIGECGGVATGKITFKDGTIILGTTSLNDQGLAYYSTSKLSVGDHKIHTAYDGDNNFRGSHALVIQTVQ